MPANFKTYEAQCRLLAAVVAATPGLKLDFKAVARAYGSDTTPSSIDHRLRPVKTQAKAIQAALAENRDPKDLNIGKDIEIAKYFGESTPGGLAFQFRQIKQEADKLKAAVDRGEDPSKIKMTPSKARVQNKLPGSGSSTGSKRKHKVVAEVDDDDDDNELDTSLSSTQPSTPSVKRSKNVVSDGYNGSYSNPFHGASFNTSNLSDSFTAVKEEDDTFLSCTEGSSACRISGKSPASEASRRRVIVIDDDLDDLMGDIKPDHNNENDLAFPDIPALYGNSENVYI